MPQRRQRRLLIVDDEKDVLTFLGNILRREGFEVIAAASGQEAIELARKLSPDLIILDILIPDINGAAVAAILSEGEATAQIPILFLTVMINKEEEQLLAQPAAARKPGTHPMLAKPVNKKALLETINKILFP